MLLRFTIVVFSLLLSGPGLEVKAEGALSERSEVVEVTLREVCHQEQSIRLFKNSSGHPIRHAAEPRIVARHAGSPVLSVNRDRVIQLRRLLI